jgi:uncharacterized phage protein (TIGR01671 family)
MREIKFRAWTGSDWFVQGEPDIETIGSFFFHVDDKWPLMQFTGLKDKNGKEIFEGDVVQAVSVRWQIAWSDASHQWYGKGLSGHDDVPLDLIQHSEHFLVIGNIYENPELLAPDKATPRTCSD